MRCAERLYGLYFLGFIVFFAAPLALGASGVGSMIFWLALSLWNVLAISAILFLPGEPLVWARQTGEWFFLILAVIGFDMFGILIRLMQAKGG